MQTAAALLSQLPAIKADSEAISLLQSIEGCCTVLNKLINNVLKLKQLSYVLHPAPAGT